MQQYKPVTATILLTELAGDVGQENTSRHDGTCSTQPCAAHILY